LDIIATKTIICPLRARARVCVCVCVRIFSILS